MSEMLKDYKEAAALAKNSSIRRLISIVTVGVTVSVGGLLAFLSWVVPWRWLKVVFCYLSAASLLSILLGLAFGILPLRLPPKLVKQLAMFLALWITIAVYFVSNHTFRLLVAGGIALLFTVPAFVMGVWRYLTEWYFPRLALKEYLRGKAGRWGRFGLVVSQRGTAARYARHLMKEFSSAMGFARGEEQFFSFMTMDSFRRFPSDFQQSAIKSVPALLVVRKAFGENDRDFRNAVQEHFRVSSGLIFEVLLIGRGDELAATNERRGVETFPFLISDAERERGRVKEIVSAINDQLTATGIPIGESDDKLQVELRQMISVVATKGFPPLANCYLRFRLSKSNVERFLCLLDCFEVLIKVSVLYSLVRQWERNAGSQLAKLYTQLQRPSLGTWLDILRRLNADPGQDELAQAACIFWKEPLAGAPRQLISDAKGSGLAYPGDLPRSHLAWLDWFVWLRNTTRGHGGVEEDQVGPVWHGLHATFLRMARGLKPLIADSGFAAAAIDGSLASYSGWNRNLQRQSKPEGELPLPANPVFLVRNGASEHQKVLLHPFIIKCGDDFLIWNSARENAIEYLDYGTGKVHQAKSGEVNPYNLWQLWQAKG